MTSAAIRTRIGLGAAAGVAVALMALAPVSGSTPKFFDDDPITRVPESQDASGVAEWEIDLFYDLMYNTFGTPRTIKTGWRAQNLNTIEEVPDSGWFTNRILARPLSAEQLLQGANTSADGGLDLRKGGKLTIIKPKDVGAAPGAVVRGPGGETWFISFDPPCCPEAASGSIMVASRLFWALGYWQAEQFLATVREEDFEISPDAVIRPPSGNKRPMKRDDLQALLKRVYRYGDGSYRIAASKLLPGKVLGGFRYHGTRPDDPNDIVPHEHRRELRALKVFGAWTNLTDMKAGNTIDTLVTDERGRKTVRHWLQDVGSTFGIGANGQHDWWEGWEPLYSGGVAWKRIYTLGFYLAPWQTARLREARLDRHLRRQGVRSGVVEAPEPAGRLSRGARRRQLLGRAPGGGLHRRDDPDRREGGPLQRSGRREAPGRRPDRAARQDRPGLPAEDQSHRRRRARSVRRPDLRERRRRCARRRASDRRLPRGVGGVRQRDRAGPPAWSPGRARLPRACRRRPDCRPRTAPTSVWR